MKRTLKYMSFALAVLSSGIIFSQNGKLQSVSDDYQDFAYVKTSEVLLEVANKGYKSPDLFEKLANSYYFRNEMADAAKWYGELIALDDSAIDPEIYFRYALALKGIEDYAASDKWMKRFTAVNPEDSRGKAFMSKVDYKSRIEASSLADVAVTNLEFNTSYSDFGVTEYEDNLLFSSSRGGGRKYRWNEEPYLDLYQVKATANGSYEAVEALKGGVNTKYHESSPTLSSNGRYMFFTRNNYYKRYYKEDDTGINRLQLYRATLQEDGSWDAIEKVHFNSEAYSVAHPALNASGTRLYFASDMPGSLGQSDIFVVDVNEDGSLGTPENLGPSINTEGQESFPFLNTNGDLFYASTGLPGLGGLDVFKSEALDNKRSGVNRYFTVENVGKPVNSSSDDFAYYESYQSQQVYFSSNRSGGKGSDDIYSFAIPDCQQLVRGVVKDKATAALLSNASVLLLDSNGNELSRKAIGSDGRFEFTLDCEKTYLVRGEKENYTADEKRFTTPNKTQDLELELLLAKEAIMLNPCDDLAKLLDIPMIYFDFDKFNIRYDAEIELQKVLAVLQKYPTMTIDIRSHTDCRGTAAYNERLSDQRAQSTRAYLIKNGIAAERLTAKGYGESQLLNACGCEPTNQSDCSEAEHQKNRRSEFIITSLNGKTCDDN